eukprot:6177079-Pleurochrysis_carterae.AAC.3
MSNASLKRAFVAANDPKRPCESETWSNLWNPWRWCKGAHWHRDCPNRKRDTDKLQSKAKLKRNKQQARASLASADNDNAERASDAAISSLFALGSRGGKVSFFKVI